MASIVVIPAARLEIMNQIFAALPGGPYQFSRALCPANISNPTHETNPTHYMLQDMGSTPGHEQVLSDMAKTSPELPEIIGEWGQDGLPEQAAAQAAIGPGNIRAYNGHGFQDTTERDGWRDDQLNTAFGGLQFVPDEPI